ncbi:MAG TPA: hypothetical protein VKV04_11480 [Verrucomicrobiae bacterium]|nr:hypothetical protein [Verrucomicrobiae bacterium]
MNAIDLQHGLRIAGGLLALLLFVPMIAGILRDEARGQSCASWLLWTALDAVLTISLIARNGNFLLPLGFTIGDIAVVVVLVLIVKGKFEWGRFDTLILALVIGCVIAWKLGGPRTAAIASTLGVCIAGIPGLVAMWREPQRRVGTVWGGYVIANGLSFFGGTAMTVEERFAPGMFAMVSLALFMASRRNCGAKIQQTT